MSDEVFGLTEPVRQGDDLRFTGSGNLIPDAGYAWYKTLGTRWVVGSPWTIATVTTETTAKRGKYRADLANTVIASDDFSDNQTDTWLNADVGGAWAGTGSAPFDKAGGKGTISGAAGSVLTGSLAISVTHLHAPVRVRIDKIPVGGMATAVVLVRYVDASNHYRINVDFKADATIDIRLVKDVAGVLTTITTVATGITYTANTDYWIRPMATGTSPTTLRARVWLDGGTEPTTWTLDDSSDSSGALQVAAGIALRATTGAGVSNGPILYSFDDFTVHTLLSTTGALVSDYIAVGLQQGYAYAGEMELLALNGLLQGTYRVQLEEYDSSKTIIQTTDLVTFAGADGPLDWPTVETARFEGSGLIAPTDAEFLDLHANARYVKLRYVADGYPVGSWKVTAHSIVGGYVPLLTSSPDASAHSYVQIDAGGIVVTEGGILVQNSGATVIIDGQSDHFKIAASGTMSLLVNAGTSDQTSTTLTALGALATVPAYIAYVATGNSPTTARYLRHATGSLNTFFVAATSGGAVTSKAVVSNEAATVFINLNGSNEAVVSMTIINSSTNNNTYYCYYYVLKEAAL